MRDTRLFQALNAAYRGNSHPYQEEFGITPQADSKFIEMSQSFKKEFLLNAVKDFTFVESVPKKKK